LYRVRRPSGDPKKARVFVVVSRTAFIAVTFPTVVCAPVYSRRRGLATEVNVGVDEGLKQESAVLCDVLDSLPKSQLTDYVGTLSPAKLVALKTSLRIALALE